MHKLITFTQPHPVALGINKSPGVFISIRANDGFSGEKRGSVKVKEVDVGSLFQWQTQGRVPGFRPPPYFYTKLRPEEPKNFFWRLPPPPPPPCLRVWMTGSPLSEGLDQWQTQGRVPSPPLFLYQTEARRAEKPFLETAPPRPLVSGSG